jgi:8-oxo-dGTP pyrophosphatase MutT (NUDIX family)
MDSEESPITAVQREVYEETGYEVQVEHLIGIYSAPFKDDIVLCFRAKIMNRKNWQPNDEISELSFFERDGLPQPMNPRALRRIQDAFEGKVGITHVFDPE